MQIGIFTSVFQRDTLEERLQAVRSHGVACVQFDFGSAGMESMPGRIEPKICGDIRDLFASNGVTMSAINGTFNMIHPLRRVRNDGLARLRVLAQACKSLDDPVITLCTGSRDPNSMWRRDPANDSPDAWADLVETMELALDIAEEIDVTLAFEPEVSNTIDSARKARMLLDIMDTPRLKVVMDGANIFHAGELPHMTRILEEAIDLLAGDIAIAHAKDLDHDGDAGNLAAGTGLLNYPLYLSLLKRSGYTGPLILHGLTEAQAGAAISFLQDTLAAIS